MLHVRLIKLAGPRRFVVRAASKERIQFTAGELGEVGLVDEIPQQVRRHQMQLGNGLQDVKVFVELVYFEIANTCLVFRQISHQCQASQAILDGVALDMLQNDAVSQ